MILKYLFEDFFKNILRIFSKSSHKSYQKVSKYGSCYPIRTYMLNHVKIG
jgi:hypothetical protein